MDRTFWRGKRALVTGGAGFIGSHLTLALFDAGATVTVAARTCKSRLWKGCIHKDHIRYVNGDLRDHEFAHECTRHQDVVFHFASLIAGLAYNSRHPADMLAYNTMLDLQVISAAAKNGVPLFFYPSAAMVYDNDALAPIRETASTTGEPVAACKGAAWAKRVAEKALGFFLEEYGMQTVTARFSNVYGPGGDFNTETAHLLGNVIRRVGNNEAPEVWGDGSQRRSYLYIDSAIEAILLLCENSVTDSPVNVGGQQEESVRNIINLVIDISGRPLRPISRDGGPSGLQRKVLDIGRLQKTTGFEERISLGEGLRKTYDWYVAFREDASESVVSHL